jgi:uncharacterized membrane protein
MRKAFAVGLALLGLTACLPTGVQATANGVVWWDQTAPNDGYHMRIPVVVKNPYDFPVTDSAAFAEIDIAARLLEAGWIRQPQGDADVLKSFSLDLDSVRVVEVTDLQAASSGPSHGRLVTYDANIRADDSRRYEVPCLVYTGALQRPDAQPFDADTNPLVTVIWRVEGELLPNAAGGAERFFMIYFDSTRNGDKQPASYADSRGGAGLESTFWAGSGLTLYGNVAPAATEVGVVHVIPLHDGTRFTVETRNEAGIFQPVTAPNGFPSNPTTLSRHEAKALFVASGRSAVFRVQASKPALAFVEGAGFVPSLEGSMLGKEFIFPLSHDPVWEQDSIYFAASDLEETVVEVRRLGDSNVLRFEMNTPANDAPYTTGARSGTFQAAGTPGACTLVNPTRPSPLLTTPGYYEAKVTRGGPVLLQIASTRGVVQIPSRLGAPSGTSFSGAVGWSDRQSNHNGANPACNDTSRSGYFMAAAVRDPAALRASSPDFIGQVYPTGRDPSRLPAPAPVGRAPADQDGPVLSPLLDRPIRFEADRPVSLFAGNMPPIRQVQPLMGVFGFPDGDPVRTPAGIPFVNGPVGGAEGARIFSSYGASTVLALFDDTVVSTDLEYTASGRLAATTEMAAFGVLDLEDLGELDQLGGLRLEANRPVLLIPTKDHSAALAAVPAFLQASQSAAEFRGYMVRVSSPSGLNPVTDSTLPGTPITYKVLVTNLGRGLAGSGLADTVRLTATGPAGWEVRLDRQDLFLQTDQTAEVHVTVTPPPSLASGSVGQVSVRATSSGNPKMDDSLQLVTLIKRSFGVGIWFDQVGNPQRTQTRIVPHGAEAVYNVTVKNTGAVPDVIAVVATLPGEPDWQVRLRTIAGQAVESLSLASGASARLQLVATPGPAASDATIVTAITASSTSEPSAQDQLIAITKMRSPSNVRLLAPKPVGYVEPGQTFYFPLQFRNTGTGSAELFFEVEVSADPVWNLTGVMVRDAAGKPTANLTDLTIAPGQTVDLWLAATASSSAPAWAFAQAQVSARIAGMGQTLEAVLQAGVLPVHRLDQALPPLPLLAQQDATNLSAKVRLTNAGNLNESLLVRAADVPDGWTVVLPKSLSINKTATQEITVTIGIPASARPGAYNVSLALESEDGNVTIVRLPTLLGTLTSASGEGASNVLARPGAPAIASFLVRNDGNVPVALQLSAPTEAWSWASPQANLVLPPGAQVRIRVSYSVPLDAPDGASEHALRLAMKPTDSHSTTIVQTLSTRVSVGRPDLTALAPKAFSGPGGLLVRAQVRNVGNRLAENVTVELRSTDRVLDRIQVQEIAAGSISNVTLVGGPHESGTLRFVVDAANANVEADESNNAVQVEVVSPPGPTPGFSSVTVLVGIGIGLASMERRRRHR